MTPPKADFRALKSLWPYLWPQGQVGLRIRVVAAMASLLLSKVLMLVFPMFYRDAVDALSTPEVQLAAVPIAILVSYGTVRIIAALFAELRDVLFAKVEFEGLKRMAGDVFRHVHNLSMRFHLDRQTGGLSRSIDRGTKGVETFLRFTTFSILPTLFEIISVCVWVWWLYGFLYGSIIFATLALYVFYSLWITEWRAQYVRAMNQADSGANTRAVDSLLNYETVKYFGAEDHEFTQYHSALERYKKAAIMDKLGLSVINSGQAIILAVGVTVTMILAAFAIHNGEMKVGDFVLLNSYMLQVSMPLNILGFAYREIKRALVDMEDMFSLLRIQPEVTDAPQAPALEVSAGRITFSNVSFHYAPEREILKDISFDITPGTTVAVVGPTGSGKSTLVRLLYRFYDVTSGAILIDGQNIQDVTQRSLRAAIGIVPQDMVLFNDTLYYNILYGNPSASRAEVLEAAEMAHLDRLVKHLPQGYDTLVGERGLKLSGGEKQRVAIARTFLKKPKIYVFDEATSALDSKTERDIQTSFRKVSRHHTALVIAHRLSTIVDAANIIVLKEGRVVEQGTHAALLRLNGLYASLWEQQARDEAQEDIKEES